VPTLTPWFDKHPTMSGKGASWFGKVLILVQLVLGRGLLRVPVPILKRL